MAKRKRKTTKTEPEPKSQKPQKKATPENPRPAEPSATKVNPMYDEMPDSIDDPGNVFRMAMLDMKCAALNNKLAFVAQDQEKKVLAAVNERDRTLKEVKGELDEAKRELVQQRQFIEEKYGIALRAYTYNDQTGILTKNALLVEEEKKKNAEKSLSEGEEGENKVLH